MAGRARSGEPSLRDVAELANVSLATASKAMNGRADVAEPTRRRVLDAAESLGFRASDRPGVRRAAPRTIGLLSADLGGRFARRVAEGARAALGDGRLTVLSCHTEADSDLERQHVDALLDRRLDGLIVVAGRTDPRPPLRLTVPIPVVYVYGPSQDHRDFSLVPDDVAGGRTAADHLMAAGRSSIAHITGNPDSTAARERACGVRSALQAAGLRLVGGVMAADWSERWGREASAKLIARHPDVDAIACGSDPIARGALDSLRDLGRRVPEDVAVIGYDNWEALSADSQPRLTTVDPDLERFGAEAATRLIAAGEPGDSPSGSHRLPPRLVIRDSTVAAE